MSLHINLLGDEVKSHALSCLSALHAYVHGTASAPDVTTAAADTPAVPDAAAAGAAATKAAAASAKAAAAAAKKQKDIDDAAAAAANTSAEPEVTVEQIRAVAGEFNNDTTRPVAVGILSKFGAPSVSWFKDQPASVRAEVLAALTAALKEVQAAALTA